MLHIHCRWIALPPDADLETLADFSNLPLEHAGEDKTDQGSVHLFIGSGASDPVADFWYPSAGPSQHRVAIYRQLMPDHSKPGEQLAVIGIASAEPSATSHILQLIFSYLRNKNAVVAPLRLDLSYAALSSLEGCRVDSVSYRHEEDSVVYRFGEAHPAYEFEKMEQPGDLAGVTLLLGDERETSTVINLFTDGQMFVGNATYGAISAATNALSSLWRVGDSNE